jgi:peptide/nickel transport system substrate-binding protein
VKVACLVALGVLVCVPATASATTTLRINSLSDVDYIDPALDDVSTGWQLEYLTCSKLVNYPDAAGTAGNQLVPDAAVALPSVSANGRTYTFKIRRGITFSTGEKVTAATFKHVLERDLSPAMLSPSQPFLNDIVGAQAMIDGDASTLSGVVAKRLKLQITLVAQNPTFLARLAMPFTCAVPLSTPVNPNGVGAPLPAAGPYFIASYTPGQQLVLRRNPHYKGARPHTADEVVITEGVAEIASLYEIENGEADWAMDGLTPAAYQDLYNRYGPSSPHQQFFVNPQLGTSYIAMNTSRPLFSSPTLRKAVNYAIDRPNYLIQGGFMAGSSTDQILPPGMPGFRDDQLYPLTGPDLATARSLAGDLHATAVLYSSTSAQSQLQSQIVQADLAQIGITVDAHSFPRSVQIQKEGTRGEPFDLTVEGWIADYADPADFMSVLLDGTTIHDSGNLNVSYFDDPQWNAAIEAAARVGDATARANAYADLDQGIMSSAPPWAAMYNFNARDFFSARIGNVFYQPVYGVDLGALTYSG